MAMYDAKRLSEDALSMWDGDPKRALRWQLNAVLEEYDDTTKQDKALLLGACVLTLALVPDDEDDPDTDEVPVKRDRVHRGRERR